MKILYKKFLRPILFLFDAELIHNLFIIIGEIFGMTFIGRFLISLFYKYNGPDISKTVDGIKYKTPIILAAGFDYDGRLTQILHSVSFGGVEVGSITLHPYKGNKKPRLIRLIRNQSIIVNKGLKNQGVQKIISRLKHRKHKLIVGINIARTNNYKTIKINEGIKDFYATLVRLVKVDIGDFYTINISCPNIFGGEEFTKPDLLDRLLSKLMKVKHTKPMYIKMPINKTWEEFDELLRIIIKYKKINGVIIGNLNKNYDDLEFRDEAPTKYCGGLSGKPTYKLSNYLIRKTKQKYKNKLTIIGCGGIITKEDAINKFKAGADLIQLITGMIFEGPHLMKEICYAYSIYIKNFQKNRRFLVEKCDKGF